MNLYSRLLKIVTLLVDEKLLVFRFVGRETQEIKHNYFIVFLADHDGSLVIQVADKCSQFENIADQLLADHSTFGRLDYFHCQQIVLPTHVGLFRHPIKPAFFTDLVTPTMLLPHPYIPDPPNGPLIVIFTQAAVGRTSAKSSLCFSSILSRN